MNDSGSAFCHYLTLIKRQTSVSPGFLFVQHMVIFFARRMCGDTARYMRSFLGVRLALFSLLLCLTACKIELYNKLSEEEANQMLALLLLSNVDADKQPGKAGDITLRVEKDQFVNAVEILRQNGFPKRKTDTMADLFPSGQLVTSPAQEQAKMTYLKEQQLEKMLSSMDGVIHAQVSIAETISTDSKEELPPPSAAVFIKYSPEANLANREAEIKSLIHDGVPNLRPDNISVVLQAADYRYLPKTAAVTPSAQPGWQIWLATHKWKVLMGIGVITLITVVSLLAASLLNKGSKAAERPR